MNRVEQLFPGEGLHGEYGLKRYRVMRRTKHVGGAAPPERADRHWGHAVTTQDSQGNVSCCVSAATANDIELKLRMAFGRDKLGARQVDMFRLHRATRKKFYGDEREDAGVELDMAARVAMEEGLYPEGTELVEVEPDAGAIYAALNYGGLIQGLALTKGWGRKMVSRVNGAVDEGYQPDMFALHATYLIGLIEREGKTVVAFVNSWIPWGQNGSGLGVMSWKEWASEWKWCGSNPISVRMPEKFDKEGWWKRVEPWLTKAEDDGTETEEAGG